MFRSELECLNEDTFIKLLECLELEEKKTLRLGFGPDIQKLVCVG